MGLRWCSIADNGGDQRLPLCNQRKNVKGFSLEGYQHFPQVSLGCKRKERAWGEREGGRKEGLKEERRKEVRKGGSKEGSKGGREGGGKKHEALTEVIDLDSAK